MFQAPSMRSSRAPAGQQMKQAAVAVPDREYGQLLEALGGVAFAFGADAQHLQAAVKATRHLRRARRVLEGELVGCGDNDEAVRGQLLGPENRHKPTPPAHTHT